MRFFADLHIHSRFSRATSKDVGLENLCRWAQIKGISVLGTADFTHPDWFHELEKKLNVDSTHLLKLDNKYWVEPVPESCASEVYFLLSAEISCIYSKRGRVRKVHNLILAPDFTAASQLNRALSKIGSLSSDGRPILGLDSKTLLNMVLDVSDEMMLIPAHAWTPHFSVFGASSGFDSLEECFDELTPHIYAIETGLSSNPPMNWRLSPLDSITLVSNSDAHSLEKLGREANIFDTEMSYEAITTAIRTRRGFAGTVEFFPEEGKYHFDGHRACGVRLAPDETVKHRYRCPVCGKKVTIGVMHRVEQLADRRATVLPPNAPPFYSIIPLRELISEIRGIGANSKAVGSEYFQLIEKLGSELRILIDVPLEEIGKAGSPQLQEAIRRMRAGDVRVAPGFDGEYGTIRVFGEPRRKEVKGRQLLF